MSLTERDKALRAHGVNPEALKARAETFAEALLLKLKADAPEATPPSTGAPANDVPLVAEAQDASVLTPPESSRRSRASGRVVWLSTVSVVAIAAAVAFVLLRQGEIVPGPRAVADAAVPTHEPRSPMQLAADARRAVARDACARHAWSDCLRAFDEARVDDQAGDDAPDVKALRAAAAAGLAEDLKKEAPEPTEHKGPK